MDRSLALALGVDVGGTTIKSAVVDPTGRADQFRRVNTPVDDPTGERTASIVAGLLRDHLELSALSAVGVAVPGVVDDPTGIVTEGVNLGWRDVPFRDLLRDRIDLPVAFAQDVRSGAFAETAADPGADDSGVTIFVPVGTGIAAAIVIDGTALVSAGWAGEIGQFVLASNPARRDIAAPLTLERVASAASIARRLGVPGARDAAESVRNGDAAAIVVWSDAIDALAESLAWCAAVVGAERIIVGGGLAESGPLLLDPLRDGIHRRLGTLRKPAVVGARLGDRAGAIGAGLLAHRAYPHDAPRERAARDRATQEPATQDEDTA